MVSKSKKKNCLNLIEEEEMPEIRLKKKIPKRPIGRFYGKMDTNVQSKLPICILHIFFVVVVHNFLSGQRIFSLPSMNGVFFYTGTYIYALHSFSLSLGR